MYDCRTLVVTWCFQKFKILHIDGAQHNIRLKVEWFSESFKKLCKYFLVSMYYYHVQCRKLLPVLSIIWELGEGNNLLLCQESIIVTNAFFSSCNYVQVNYSALVHSIALAYLISDAWPIFPLSGKLITIQFQRTES